MDRTAIPCIDEDSLLAKVSNSRFPSWLLFDIAAIEHVRLVQSSLERQLL